MEGFVNKLKTVHNSAHIPFGPAQSHGPAVRLAMVSVGAENEQDLIYKHLWRSHNILAMMTYSLFKITQFYATVLNCLC